MLALLAKLAALYAALPQEVRKVLTGAGIAGAGAVLTYAIEFLGSVSFGPWQPVAVAVLSVLANIARKLAAASAAK